MRGNIAWTWSANAFEASRREDLPRLWRQILVRTGVLCFWAALTVEYRAMEVWREQRAQRALVRPPRRQRWQLWLRRTQERLPWGRRSQCLPVDAWSLPDNPRMRGLGLGHMWAVLCPYCDDFHTHSPGEGHRTPHCCSEKDRRHYVLAFAGCLPVEHRTRFYRSSKSGLPRLLHHWPEAAGLERGERHERDEAPELLAA